MPMWLRSRCGGIIDAAAQWPAVREQPRASLIRARIGIRCVRVAGVRGAARGSCRRWKCTRSATFLAVARTLNFTRAAEQCNVSQPALTRAVRQLEEELSGKLLRREGKHLAPDRPRPAHGASHAAVLRERARRQDAGLVIQEGRRAGPVARRFAQHRRLAAGRPVGRDAARLSRSAPQAPARRCRRDQREPAEGTGPISPSPARWGRTGSGSTRGRCSRSGSSSSCTSSTPWRARSKSTRAGSRSSASWSAPAANRQARWRRPSRRLASSPRRRTRSARCTISWLCSTATSALPSCRKAPSIIRHCGESRSTALP